MVPALDVAHCASAFSAIGISCESYRTVRAEAAIGNSTVCGIRSSRASFANG